MKALLIDPEKCTGCKLCELTCSFVHEGEFNLSNSRIWVHQDKKKASFVPTVCESCAHTPCIYNCPVAAITLNEKLGIPVVNIDECISCGQCEDVCPYEGVKLEPVEEKAMKCDLCGGNPECVEVCFPGAIQVTNITDKVALREKSGLALRRLDILEKDLN